MNKDPIIIALAGTSGAGKSTTISKLAKMLDDAAVIYFDDYTAFEAFPMLDDISATYFGCPPTETPRDHEAWFNRGADLNEIESPQLAEHLHALKLGQSVTSPYDGRIVAPAKYIIFEGPLGRAHQKTGQYIDYMVFIDLPLDVGFVRMLLRDIGNILFDEMTRDEAIGQLKSVKMLADSYLITRRRYFLAITDPVKSTSDLIVDGEQSAEEKAKAIIDGLAQR